MKLPKNREVYYALTGILSERGLAYELVNDGKHPKLVFDHNGRRIRLPFSTTPSDGHAVNSARRQLRKILQ